MTIHGARDPESDSFSFYLFSFSLFVFVEDQTGQGSAALGCCRALLHWKFELDVHTPGVSLSFCNVIMLSLLRVHVCV